MTTDADRHSDAGYRLASHASSPEPTAETAQSGPTGSGLGADWPSKAADLVDLVADVVHDRAIRPLLLAARVVVFGLIVAVLSLVVLVLVSIGLVRILDVYAFGGRVWISDAVLGAVFTLAGLAAWSRRSTRSKSVHG
ncbi:MAG: hypothetical protein M0Z95_06340 [Actinomycetota bacterium]|jgi:hypothetical protein|nr:hypothetical protein [Actinomycetota bacterium]